MDELPKTLARARVNVPPYPLLATKRFPMEDSVASKPNEIQFSLLFMSSSPRGRWLTSWLELRQL